MVFHESCMALSASSRLATKIALHERPDFCFGLRQSHDVCAYVQLTLSVAADHPVLPKGQTVGVTLVNSRNAEISFVERIEHINVAEVARVERDLDLCSGLHSPPQSAQLRAVVLQPFQFNAIVKCHTLSRHAEHDVKFTGALWQRRRQAVHLGLPSMRRGVGDAAMRCL